MQKLLCFVLNGFKKTVLFFHALALNINWRFTHFYHNGGDALNEKEWRRFKIFHSTVFILASGLFVFSVYDNYMLCINFPYHFSWHYTTYDFLSGIFELLNFNILWFTVLYSYTNLILSLLSLFFFKEYHNLIKKKFFLSVLVILTYFFVIICKTSYDSHHMLHKITDHKLLPAPHEFHFLLGLSDVFLLVVLLSLLALSLIFEFSEYDFGKKFLSKRDSKNV